MGRKIVTTGDITGDVGTVIDGSNGPVVMNGDVYVDSNTETGGRTYSGDGMTVIEGDNTGGIHRSF